MENSEVRFYDVRSSKGRLPFLQKVGLLSFPIISIMFPVQMLPEVPEPPIYWPETDPRSEAAHLGIISQMVIDIDIELQGIFLCYICDNSILTPVYA